MNHHSERSQDLVSYKFDRAKENLYLDRIAALMDTNRATLDSYAKIKLWEDGPNYQKVVQYVNNSQCHPSTKLTVVNIPRVWLRNRDDDNLFHLSNRHLLWHGTKRANIPHILNNGFKLPAKGGQMFGSGIYFADRITKSSNYSDMDVTFLLLCEVGLGNVYSCRRSHNDWTSPPLSFDSVKANGTYVPDWTESARYYGAQIPFGRTAKCTKYDSHAVNYNEFIVYDPSRIIIRFLVEVKVEKVTVPVPLRLITPRSVVPISKDNRRTSYSATATKPTQPTHVARIARSNGLHSYSTTAMKPTVPSSNVAHIQHATASTIARSNSIRSSYSATAMKPTVPSSNVAHIQHATASTIARSNSIRSSYSATSMKPNVAPIKHTAASTTTTINIRRSTYFATATKVTLPSSNVAPTQYGTVNTIARSNFLRSSPAATSMKPTQASSSARSTNAYDRFYNGYSSNASSISSIPVHRAEQQQQKPTCVIL